MSIWRISTLNDEAAQELIELFSNQDVRDETKRILKILASQSDPRKPSKSAGLIVNEIEHDAPGWFRVKVPRYAVRIVFRLLIVQEEKIIELALDELASENDERYIDITQAGRHPDIYGKRLRDRYKRMKNQN